MALSSSPSPSRYHALIVFLHWGMALAFALMLTSGLVMDDLPKALKFEVFQWHKSLGVCLLILFFVRLAARQFFSTPAFPERFPSWEKWAAKLGHWGLYFLMIVMPLTGWIMVSASVYGLPTIVFGAFTWPHVPGIAGNVQVGDAARNAHEFFSDIFMVMIALHVAAVIKHLVKDRENLLSRMGLSWSRQGKT